MNRPKIRPKRMIDSVTNRISGYLGCVKLGIFLLTSQVPKSKSGISVPKMAPKIETKQLIVTVLII